MRIFLSLIFFLFVMTCLAWAQPGMPSGPTQVPIDGGLGLLAAAGGSYAVYKLRQKKSEE
jgi:hypothetical protein